MSQKTNIAILILAAGDSTRMGTPKQLLKWKNTTLLGHAIETVQKSNAFKICVVLGANHNLINTKINNYQVEVLVNESWEKGLGSSIAFGVNHLLKSDTNFDAVFIMLADQPLIDSVYLNKVLDTYEIGKRQIIATTYKGEKQGVPVLFDAIYFEELSQLNDNKGAKRILQKYFKNVSAISADNLVSDIDTLEDYQRLYNINHR
ncbi:MAG: nucleotidyltransferase family protein [Chlorobi bacterium]|nr:nucleotidyltransferase family protein [Chlorobiota bacterium]